MIRWCAPLVVALGVLMALTLRLGRHEARRAVFPIAEDPPASEPAAAPTPDRDQADRAGSSEASDRAPPRANPPARRNRSAPAKLHGRVVISPEWGNPDDLGDLEVVADDGERIVVGQLLPGGRFAFHLPPGRYTLAAGNDDLAGMTAGVVARADQELEIDVPLGPAARIAGTVRAPEGAEISVKATPVGGTHVAGSEQSVEGESFTLRGLIPGRRYDLAFSGPTIRTTTLRSIAAPTDALEVALAGLPIVRGAIGFLDDTCPVDAVSLHGPGIAENDAPTAEVDADCQFELTAPEGASQPTLVATGPGWRLEDTVSLPTRGDPDPICLNPPCRSDQLEPQARLAFHVAHAPPL